MKITRHSFTVPFLSFGEILTVLFLLAIIVAMCIGMYIAITESVANQKQVDQLFEFVEQNCTATGVALNKDFNDYKVVYSCPDTIIENAITEIKREAK